MIPNVWDLLGPWDAEVEALADFDLELMVSVVRWMKQEEEEDVKHYELCLLVND